MLDAIGRNIDYLRLSVTELCNLRCRYCMPEDGVCKKQHEDMLTEDEMINAVRVAERLGISKVRITGGEPLVKKNIVSVCQRISQIPHIEEVCITTNGTKLPELAKSLYEAGVNRINISLDTLNPEKYEYITRRNRSELDRTLEGIQVALDTGFQKVKINTVLIGGFNDDEILAMAELTKAYSVDVRFIELMPMYDGGEFGEDAFISNTKVLEILPDLLPEEVEDGVAKLYRIPGAKGRIGLISPVSNHFCATCNRLRLTADGYLKPCLHSGQEFKIKGLSEDEMKKVFQKAILEKPVCHSEFSYEMRSEAGRNMNEIGG